MVGVEQLFSDIANNINLFYYIIAGLSDVMVGVESFSYTFTDVNIVVALTQDYVTSWELHCFHTVLVNTTISIRFIAALWYVLMYCYVLIWICSYTSPVPTSSLLLPPHRTL